MTPSSGVGETPGSGANGKFIDNLVFSEVSDSATFEVVIGREWQTRL